MDKHYATAQRRFTPLRFVTLALRRGFVPEPPPCSASKATKLLQNRYDYDLQDGDLYKTHTRAATKAKQYGVDQRLRLRFAPPLALVNTVLPEPPSYVSTVCNKIVSKLIQL